MTCPPPRPLHQEAARPGRRARAARGRPPELEPLRLRRESELALFVGRRGVRRARGDGLGRGRDR